VNRYTWGAIGVAGVLGLLTIGFFMSVTHISLGHVGMVKHPDGTVTEIGQGWHWTGIQNSVEEYPTYIQGSKYSMYVGTADSQKMHVTVNVNWQINTKDATTVYEAVGGKSIDYVQEQIVDQKVQGIVNQVTHQYTWDELLGKAMPEATEKIKQLLGDALAKNGIILDSIYFAEVDAPQGMQAAQQATATAELGKQKAKAAQEQAMIENETRIKNAEADLKVKELEAQANEKLAKSLNELLVQQQAIQKWDGHLPQTMTGNAVPFLNVGK
jgi:regulator of protease activity HflC (stomatin/prohibitin superfamily)